MLYPDTTVINNDAITQLFVAYKFLNCDPAELETPFSLPKPAPDRPVHYNFKKGEEFLHLDLFLKTKTLLLVCVC